MFSEFHSEKILDAGETCYFVTYSIDNPYLLLKFMGRVKVREIDSKLDKIHYIIEAERILEDRKSLSRNFNNMYFQLNKKDTYKKTTKKISLLNHFDHHKVENDLIDNVFSKYYFTIPSIHTFTTEKSMLTFILGINDKLKKIFIHRMREVLERTNTIEALLKKI